MNQIMTNIFINAEDNKVQLELNKDFVVQVLQDILYGIEQEDKVFLHDVLKYGIEEIYKYIIDELEAGEKNE